MLTGGASVFLRLHRVNALWLSPYGRLILAKTFFVSLVLALGAAHARTVLRHASGGTRRSVRGSLTAEVAFAALTIAATAMLAATEPPG